jgi:hypothetical protein
MFKTYVELYRLASLTEILTFKLEQTNASIKLLRFNVVENAEHLASSSLIVPAISFKLAETKSLSLSLLNKQTGSRKIPIKMGTAELRREGAPPTQVQN